MFSSGCEARRWFAGIALPGRRTLLRMSKLQVPVNKVSMAPRPTHTRSSR